VNTESINHIKDRLNDKVILFSELTIDNCSDFNLLIIDSVGMLSNIYQYSQYCYIGGGFGSGIHNILEPASFGQPIIFGPNYIKSKEAKELISLGGAKSISSVNQLSTYLKELVKNQDLALEKSNICKEYVLNNIGSSEQIVTKLESILQDV
ncbi:MAG: 3-deoxy-D-manno-octulosonic acid transferase, partial [Flavobacteriales bacterium]|nr:3-deoxy-D-manno-octulosonic acid transferase [Flavobacteriales bacterium]